MFPSLIIPEEVDELQNIFYITEQVQLNVTDYYYYLPPPHHTDRDIDTHRRTPTPVQKMKDFGVE